MALQQVVKELFHSLPKVTQNLELAPEIQKTPENTARELPKTLEI